MIKKVITPIELDPRSQGPCLCRICGGEIGWDQHLQAWMYGWAHFACVFGCEPEEVL